MVVSQHSISDPDKVYTQRFRNNYLAAPVTHYLHKLFEKREVLGRMNIYYYISHVLEKDSLGNAL